MDIAAALLFFLRVILGLILIFFIPGFAFTWAIYTKKTDLSSIVRIALSCVLSVAIVMISSLFLESVLGIESTGVNIVISLLSFTIVMVVIWLLRNYLQK